MDDELNLGKRNKRESWSWLSNGDLIEGTEALICAAQEPALITNYLKFLFRLLNINRLIIANKNGDFVY